MKKLVFVRHAKAEDHTSEISDFERSLTLRGKSSANLMAVRLFDIDRSEAIFITSPAFRALETAIIFTAKFGIKPEKLLLDSGIYHSMNYKYLIKILSELNEDTEKIILFGHNPSFSELPDNLCKNGCEFLPKCGIAGLSFNITMWSEIKPGTGKLDYFLKPE